MAAFVGRAVNPGIGRQGHRVPRSSRMLAACGLWLVALGRCFVALRPALLPEDVRSVGLPLARIQADIPGLERWLRVVFIVLGGFAAGTGLLLQWPTIVTVLMFPVLVVMYVRLSLTEERGSERDFGDAWRAYAAATPRFLPTWERPARTRA